MAIQLLARKSRFDFRVDETVCQESDAGILETDTLGKAFYTSIHGFRENMHKYVYWQRAWTFQEWAVAKDIEISCDFDDDSGLPGRLQNVQIHDRLCRDHDGGLPAPLRRHVTYKTWFP